jgi:molybdopterin biosynthesis enzyme MoaB
VRRRRACGAHRTIDRAPPRDAAQVDKQHCCLVVTTGGTGPAPRDVTPEATEAVCSRMMPGYGEQMRAISLK